MSKTKSHKAKRKSHKKPRKAKVIVPVKHVDLPLDGVVRVTLPPGTMPVVAADPHQRVVEIVPVKRKQSWWGSLFD